jgi:hypothetical protein
MTIAFMFLVGCVGLCVFGYWLYRGNIGKDGFLTDEHLSVEPTTRQSALSGIQEGALPVSHLTRLEFECLVEASYNVRIVSGPRAQRNCLQPDGSSVHAAETVEVLARHGFLVADNRGGYTITDLGLRASHVLCVKW